MSLKKKLAVVAGTVVLTGAAFAPAALASGTGNTVNGCTAHWYNTAFSTNCTNTTVSGYYQTYGNCNAQGDFFAPKSYVSRGATVSGISRGECRYSVSGASVYQVG